LFTKKLKEVFRWTACFYDSFSNNLPENNHNGSPESFNALVHSFSMREAYYGNVNVICSSGVYVLNHGLLIVCMSVSFNSVWGRDMAQSYI